MTNDLLLDVGEEFIFDFTPDGETMTVGVYDDSTDALGESDTLSAVSTEPGNANYARQSSSTNTKELSGDYGMVNATSVSFDFSDVSSGDVSEETLDTTMVIFNFQSSRLSQGSPQDNLVANPAMDNTHATGDVDKIDYNSESIKVTLG